MNYLILWGETIVHKSKIADFSFSSSFSADFSPGRFGVLISGPSTLTRA